MCKYEILFLATPEITKDESEGIKSSFSKIIRSHKGDMLSFERWGKYRLAYPVKKNEYGVYFLTRFEVENEVKNTLIADLKEAFVFKFNNVVMKNHFERLGSKGPLEYKRPESLEDNPQDVDTFLKKNEMEGLLKKGPVRKAAESQDLPEQDAPVEKEVLDDNNDNQETENYDEKNKA